MLLVFLFIKYTIEMKNIILFIAFIGSVLSVNAQNTCDTVKLKTIKTQYVEVTGYNVDVKGKLDGAEINIDTLPIFFPNLTVVNISNDTFFTTEKLSFQMFLFVYDNTNSILFANRIVLAPQPISTNWLPNDTQNILCFNYTFSEIIDAIESTGVNFDKISYWVVAYGVSYTSKDGTLSDSLFYTGADISTFRVVRGGVGIQGIEQSTSIVSIYPNPTRSQFMVTNTKNAELYLYNILGQEVMRTYSAEENTVINVDFIPQGLYVLKVVKDGSLSAHKIIIQK